MANCAALGTSIALTLWGPAPGGALSTLSLVVAATLAPRLAGSIDRVLWEVEAALGLLPPAADDPRPQEVAPLTTGVVTTPRRLAAEMLGPLITPGSRFLELLIVIEAWSFISLQLPDAVRRVIYALGCSSKEVMLVEQTGQSSSGLLTPSLERVTLPPSLGVEGHSPWATVSASATTSSSASSWGC
jgi:hypothetical protein